MLTEDGRVFAFGGAVAMGEPGGGPLRVDIEPTPTGHGYWVLSEIGTVWAYGDATRTSGAPLLPPGERIVSMSATIDGQGYWMFTNRGRVFTFGNAVHYGDMSGIPLNGEVLDSVATSSGKGYWMVASDGGVFSFGDAKFYGSMGGSRLNKPVMSLAPDPDGVGYWLVASDGGIFSFEATFHGSMGSVPLNKPVSGMVGQPGGYLMVAEDGGIFAFGTVEFHGSLGANPPSSRVVSVAATPKPPPPPVFDWIEIYPPTANQGTFQSLPFEVTGRNINVIHLCDANGGYTAVSCHYRLYHYPSGDWEDGWNLVAQEDGEARHRFIAVAPGWYYIEVNPIDNAFIWGFSVLEERCVQNC